MTEPRYATDYTPEQVERARKTLIHIADVLGNLFDEMVLVGGLVPMLLVDQEVPPPGLDTHVGSVDIDISLSFALVSEQRYDDLAQRLKDADFEPDTNDKGNQTLQRWRHRDAPEAVKIDFLIDESEAEGKKAGEMLNLTPDLAAIVMQGLDLAHKDFVEIALEGENFTGDRVEVTIRVCGPAPFIVLKSLARRNRDKPKDAYDLDYVLGGVDEGPQGLGARLRENRGHPAVQAAFRELESNFSSEESVGPRQASRFLYETVVDEYVADVVGRVSLLLRGFHDGDEE